MCFLAARKGWHQKALLTSSRWHKWVCLSRLGIHGFNCVNHLMHMKQPSWDTLIRAVSSWCSLCGEFFDMLMIMKRAEVQSNMRSNKPFVPQTVGITNHMERYLVLARAGIPLLLLHNQHASLWHDFSLIPSFQFCFFSRKNRFKKSDKCELHLRPGKLLNLLKTTPLSLPTGANKSMFSVEKLPNTLINFFSPPCAVETTGGRWSVFYLVKTRPR